MATGNAIAEAIDYGVKEFDNKCKGMDKYKEEREESWNIYGPLMDSQPRDPHYIIMPYSF